MGIVYTSCKRGVASQEGERELSGTGWKWKDSLAAEVENLKQTKQNKCQGACRHWRLFGDVVWAAQTRIFYLLNVTKKQANETNQMANDFSRQAKNAPHPADATN